MAESLIAAAVVIFGMCIGSFLTVCIHRLPMGKSIVGPRSSCPLCDQRIAFRDNIPVVSYLLLGGRCRHCRGRIAGRYPVVEILTGLFALCCYLKFSLTLEAAVYFAFVVVLTAVTFIDLDHRIIPNVITLPGIPIGFLAGLALPSLTVKDSILGLIVGAGSLYLTAVGYRLLTRREGMGGGDIKLMAMVGTLIGLKGVLFTIFIGSALGTAVGVMLMMHARKDMKMAIAFGPFLAIGAIAYVFLGGEVIKWYLKLLS